MLLYSVFAMFSIVCIADSDKHFSSAIEEYCKRLGKDLKIENLKPFKDDNHSLVIQKETKSLIEILFKKYSSAQKILMIKEWAKWDTLQLAQNIQAQDTVFIIGWPYGVDEEQMRIAFPQLKKLSFWAITLPHGLAKLTLIEQLYRVTTLRSGKKYHY